MADFLAWSHSRRNTYKDCPRQLYHTAVAKQGHPDRVAYVESQPMRDGNEIDKALTARVQHGTPLPPKFQPYEGMIKAIIDAPGTKLAQAQFALDQSFKQVGYKDWDNAWVRSIYDIAVVDGAHAWLGDFKNGQIWLNSDQLKLFAAVGFHIFPEVQVIDTSYVWLKHGVTSDETFHRRELPDLWAALLPDVERMQISSKTNTWPATPSKRACKFCGANREGKCSVAAVKYAG